MDFYSNYRKQSLKLYPSTKSCFESSHWKYSVSDSVVVLPSSLLTPIQKVVSALFTLKKTKSYQNFLQEQAPFPLDQRQNSVLTAYDFHVNNKGDLKLIEVNTNASGFLFSQLTSQIHGLGSGKALLSLESSFKKEWEKYSKSKSSPKTIRIVDEKPLEQKMYMEFLMYKDFFNSFGWEAAICDSQDLNLNFKNELIDLQGNKVDFIYNRTTDFYFERHPHFKQAYKNNQCCLSPHPVDYYLLADKRRLCDWSMQEDLGLPQEMQKDLRDSFLSSWILNSDSKERAWKEKKMYFFKPLQSYGGRQVYRGKGLTRSRFELILKQPFLFQEYFPPDVFVDQKGEEWKFDLRVFVYKEEIQQIVARLYKGQLTNFRHLGGGFASVRFSPFN